MVALRSGALEVTIAHALAVGEMPDHHADPFDRLLVARARTERSTLVTHDPQIRRDESLSSPPDRGPEGAA